MASEFEPCYLAAAAADFQGGDYEKYAASGTAAAARKYAASRTAAAEAAQPKSGKIWIQLVSIMLLGFARSGGEKGCRGIVTLQSAKAKCKH